MISLFNDFWVLSPITASTLIVVLFWILLSWVLLNLESNYCLSLFIKVEKIWLWVERRLSWMNILLLNLLLVHSFILNFFRMSIDIRSKLFLLCYLRIYNCFCSQSIAREFICSFICIFSSLFEPELTEEVRLLLWFAPSRAWNIIRGTLLATA